MNEIIVEKLREIENEHEVKVLFAVESGSRAWGFPSRDSDYDVRFVYIHRPEWYLAIDEKRDVIELPVSDMLDISGWDIRKAIKLFRKSNPPLLEWLVSDTVYDESYGFKEDMLELSKRVFSPRASLHHYVHMAKGNFRTYLQGEEVKIKKYFYVLRPILAGKLILKYNESPPIGYQDLVRDLVTEPTLLEAIEDLLRRKIAGEELNTEHRVAVIHDFIDRELAALTEFANSMQSEQDDPTEQLDKVFRKYLKVVWNGE